MADKRLILDVNFIVRASLGARVRGLFERYSEHVHLIAPTAAFLEVDEHLPAILRKRGLSATAAMQVYASVKLLVHELPSEAYVAWEAEARQRIRNYDPDDWPVLACAMAMECPIWTEDRDFFGCGIATWSTDRIELYLGADEPQSAL